MNIKCKPHHRKKKQREQKINYFENEFDLIIFDLLKFSCLIRARKELACHSHQQCMCVVKFKQHIQRLSANQIHILSHIRDTMEFFSFSLTNKYSHFFFSCNEIEHLNIICLNESTRNE